MGVDRVGRALNGSKVNVQPLFARVFVDLAINAQGVFPAAEFGFEVFAPVHTLGGHVGVELERVPFDGEGVVGLGLQRLFQPGLADIAPRADGIGKDINLDHVFALNWARRARRLSLPLGLVGRASSR